MEKFAPTLSNQNTITVRKGLLDEKKVDELVEAMTVVRLAEENNNAEEAAKTDEQIKDQVTGNKAAIMGNKQLAVEIKLSDLVLVQRLGEGA